MASAGRRKGKLATSNGSSSEHDRKSKVEVKIYCFVDLGLSPARVALVGLRLLPFLSSFA
jgi:hypothetical protein